MCAYYLIVPFAEGIVSRMFAYAAVVAYPGVICAVLLAGTIDLYSHFRLESVFANQVLISLSFSVSYAIFYAFVYAICYTICCTIFYVICYTMCYATSTSCPARDA